MMVNFIDQNRAAWGVEPSCDALPIAPSTYYEVKDGEADPSKLSQRRRRDSELKTLIQKVWDQNWQVYGPRKVWNQLLREGVTVGRGRIERLMRQMGLVGTIRSPGKRRTTFADPKEPDSRRPGAKELPTDSAQPAQ